MYSCHNIVADVEPEYVETYEDKKRYWGKMPVNELFGNVSFSTLGSIWGFSVMWGDEYTEPVKSAPVAQVKEEDKEILRRIGQKVQFDMLVFNKYYRLIVRRKKPRR
jgi:hypothetical protein